MSNKNTVYVKPEHVKLFVSDLFKHYGVPEQQAIVIADYLLRADLRGVDTHGISRIPIYLKRLEQGLVVAQPPLTVTKTTPVAASIDGGNGLGFVVGHKAMQTAINMADEFGIGLVSAKHSNHFGMAANYVLQAIDAGFIAMVFTNASRAMPPWGGREGLLGTNPFAAGAPSGDGVPFVLDMSPAVAARGKIRRAERLGETIPEGYALDDHGASTTDPTAALRGVVLPIGGPKGSGISMFMDIMSGVFSGSAYGGDVHDQYTVWDEPQDVGHCFIAIKPGLFITEAAFRERMDTLVDRVHTAPLAQGHDEIVMPGELESRLEKERSQQGIPYAHSDIATLNEIAEQLGVRTLDVMAV